VAAAAPPPVLTATSCQLVAGEYGDDFVSERPHCECEAAAGLGYDLWGDDGRCLVVARNARCLLDSDELPRELCVPDDAASCAGLCADLEQRLIADAAAQVDRSLAAATCGFWCTCVVEVDGACFRRIEWSGDALQPSDEVPCP
jgi:hypothetical protein